MRTIVTVVCLGALTACGSTFPAPNDQYVAAEKDVGRAQASNAEGNPSAKLYLQLAQEDLGKAKALINQDNRRAQTLIARADAEAQLAVSVTRSTQAQAEAQAATAQLTQLKGQ